MMQTHAVYCYILYITYDQRIHVSNEDNKHEMCLRLTDLIPGRVVVGIDRGWRRLPPMIRKKTRKSVPFFQP